MQLGFVCTIIKRCTVVPYITNDYSISHRCAHSSSACAHPSSTLVHSAYAANSVLVNNHISELLIMPLVSLVYKVSINY